MNFTLWRHIRLIGATFCILAYFFHNLSLATLGFLIMFFGTASGVDALENRVKELEDKNEA